MSVILISMARVNEWSRAVWLFDLPSTRCPRMEWAISPLLPSRRASPHDGRHSRPVLQSVGSWDAMLIQRYDDANSRCRCSALQWSMSADRLSLSAGGPGRGDFIIESWALALCAPERLARSLARCPLSPCCRRYWRRPGGCLLNCLIVRAAAETASHERNAGKDIVLIDKS